MPESTRPPFSLALRVAAYLPFVVCCGAIFWISDLSRPHIPDALTFRFSDKLLHAAAYSVVGAAAALGAYGRTRRVGLAVLVEGAALAAAYGVFDEVHQSFVPGRSATFSDVVADTIGAVLGAWLMRRALRHARTRPVAAVR